MSENKTVKYFKYAIGEIVLVVLGILIALQINNSNEDRKAIKKEKIFLLEFKNSIDNDLLDYDNWFDWRLEKKKSGLDSLFHYMKHVNNIHDTLFIKFYRNMRLGIRLKHDSGPYEALKSSGLDYIRNDSLRAAINRAYIILPRLQSFSHRIDAEYDPKIFELEYKILNISAIEPQDEVVNRKFEVKVDKIITNKDFLWIYDMELDKYNEYTHRLEEMKSILKELKAQIEKELKN